MASTKTSKKLKTVEIECEDCGGTGLFVSVFDAKGEACICVGCGGSGCFSLRYLPFTERKPRRGIKTVRNGFRDTEEPMTHADFVNGKSPWKK